jgi:poly(A) polymerase
LPLFYLPVRRVKNNEAVEKKDSTRQKALATEIVNRLKREGHTAYFAGGCVRDLILKTVPYDIDVATSAPAESIEKLFPKTLPVGKQFGVILVLLEGIQFEVATFRKEGDYTDGRRPDWVDLAKPEEDARRRDYTINGLFLDHSENRVIDYVEGEKDIKRRVVRTIGRPEERFREDKLRLIRAVRFAANLDFEIEEETWETIRRKAAEIRVCSSERIRDELVKIFTRPHAGRGLELLSESGLLREVLPEVAAMKGVEQSPEYHPEGDVFIHTQLLLDKLEDPAPTLAFMALLHDVGKPPTFARTGDKIHFYEHDRIGAEMTRKILERLRFSNKEIDAVTNGVGYHMRFMHVQQMREGKLKNFLTRDNFLEELELHRIDCQSSHGQLDNYEFLKEKLQHYKAEELKPKPLISGHDLIAAGFVPGPRMGTVLAEIYELQLESQLKTKEEALQWAKEHWNP